MATHELETAEAAFQRRPSPETAIDLVNVATHFQADREQKIAAAYLRSLDSRLPAGLQDLIRLTDGQDQDSPLVEPTATITFGGADAHRIRECRRRLRNEPRNIVLLLDLARAYTVIGKSAGAERLVRASLVLAPNHRVVLRRAARWMVHTGDADEAWELLRNNPRTQRDPWLMATEVSLAGVLEQNSTNIRQARKLLDDTNYGPADLTELYSALGTMEVASGDLRRGRRMVRESLVAPTDNSVAQAQWLSRADSAIAVQPELLAAPSASEARFLRAHQEGRWIDALNAAKEWQADEPYSSRPAINGSFLAASFSENPAESIEIARVGLRADPSDQLLRNNLVVGLIFAGHKHYEEAQKEHQKLRHTPGAFPLHVYRATSGLVRFTHHDWEGGRALYQQAIAEAPSAQRTLVALHWFNAESLFDPAAGELLRSNLAVRFEKEPHPLIRALIERFEVLHDLRTRARALRPDRSGTVVLSAKAGTIWIPP